MTETTTYRQRLEARMVAIAQQIVTDEGLAAVQARRIAREADCSVGTLYNIFGDLDGLLIAVNRRTLVTLGEKLATSARAVAGGSSEQRLVALALAYRDFAFEQTTSWRALFEHRMEQDKPVPVEYRAEQGRLFVLVEACLESAMPDENERATAARAMFAAVHGIVSLALDNKLGQQGASETERQICFLLSAMAHGLALEGTPGKPA